MSVDAATRDSLKAIDRPLFKDFWERFLASLQAMKDKKQRTVYRLTLVKSWNMEEADGYVKLIEMGQPDFIEIKSVTITAMKFNNPLSHKLSSYIDPLTISPDIFLCPLIPPPHPSPLTRFSSSITLPFPIFPFPPL